MKNLDILHINWCRISSINSMSHYITNPKYPEIWKIQVFFSSQNSKEIDHP